MISIIIPLYNKEKYIKDTLESLQGLSDAEILVIDNNSDDGGPAICREESRKDSRIRMLYQPIPGVSAVRNLGIKEAKGDFLCFLDADDRYENIEKLEIQAETNCFDVLIFGFKKFDSNTGKILSEHRIPQIVAPMDSRERGGWLRMMVDNQTAYNVSNKLYRTSFLRKHGLIFDESIDRLEDLSFFLCALEKANAVCCSDQATHWYRVNMEEGSLGHKYRENFDYIVKIATIYRKLESAWKDEISREQVEQLETSMYTVINRELSIMRVQGSLRKNSEVNRLLREVLMKTRSSSQYRSLSYAYLKYQLAIRCMFPLWVYTRLRWK